MTAPFSTRCPFGGLVQQPSGHLRPNLHIGRLDLPGHANSGLSVAASARRRQYEESDNDGERVRMVGVFMVCWTSEALNASCNERCRSARKTSVVSATPGPGISFREGQLTPNGRARHKHQDWCDGGEVGRHRMHRAEDASLMPGFRIAANAAGTPAIAASVSGSMAAAFRKLPTA